MRPRSPRRLLVGATALVLLAGGATALAESGSSGPGGSPQAPSIGRGLPGIPMGRMLLAPLPARRLLVTRSVRDCGLPPLIGDALKATSDYIGISGDQLMQDLRGGASLADIATTHGKSVNGLEQALIESAKTDLDKSVAAGDITAGQEQQMLTELRSRIDDLVHLKGGAPFPPRRPLGDPLAAAADYLGLSADDLVQELKDGKSLADVAKARGKSVDGLEQAIFDAEKASLQEKIHELVNAKGLPGPSCEAKLGSGAVVSAPAFGPLGTP